MTRELKSSIISYSFLTLLIIGISGPFLYLIGMRRQASFLQHILLNPPLAPFSNMPEGSFKERDWSVFTKEGKLCLISFHEITSKIPGPSKFRLPFYFAEEPFLRGDPLAADVINYWVCKYSQCEQPSILKTPTKELAVNCSEV